MSQALHSAGQAPVAVLTRPAGRNETLATRLREAGWQTCLLPALALHPLPPSADFPLPEAYDLVIFVSGNAARLYWQALTQIGQRDAWPTGTVAATVGPASAEALRECVPDFCKNTTILFPPPSAPQYDSEALWQVLQQQSSRPERVLLVRGTAGRDWLGDRLEEYGAHVTRYAVYTRQAMLWNDTQLATLHQYAQAGRAVTWLMTSRESVKSVYDNLQAAHLTAWWCNGRFVLTHPVLQTSLPCMQQGLLAPEQVKICLPNDDSIFQAFVAV